MIHGIELTFKQVAARARTMPPARLPLPDDIMGFRHAAVLVPLLHRPDGPTVLFTRRTGTLTTHKGQIAFPGGRLEPGERPSDAALREAREEIGLQPALVEIAGGLEHQVSSSGYLVAPIVGLVAAPPESFRAHDVEVERIHEAPVRRLLDPACHRTEWWDSTRVPQTSPLRSPAARRIAPEDIDDATGRFRVHFFDAGFGPDAIVWGLTARILNELLARVLGRAG